MKNVFLSLSALLMCMLMTGCGNSTDSIKSLTEDISENGNDWKDADQWEKAGKEFFEACCAFAESDFTEDELDEFVDQCKELLDAVADIDNSKAKKAMEKGLKKVGKDKDLEMRLKNAYRKAEKRLKKLDVSIDDIVDRDTQSKMERVKGSF